MKNFTSILVLVFAASFLFSCSKEDEPVEYWYSYGTYVESESSNIGFVVELDNGEQLVPTEASNIEEGVVDGSRILTVYSIVSEADSIIKAKISGISSILTKNILQLTEENKDSLGNNGVIITSNNIWFSKNHLNVGFTYYGYGKNHYINLVKPIGTQLDTDGNQILEFKHNDNGDLQSYRYNNVVSFNMWSLYEAGMDSINFVFKSMDYDSTLFSWKGTYHFYNETPAKSAQIGIPDYFQKVY